MAEHRDFPRAAAGTTVREVCIGLVDDLHTRWPLPSVYLLLDGRLRCQATRGYFQVTDGVSPTRGVIGRCVTTRAPVVVEDVTADPFFIAAIPGLQAEVTMPVWCHGEVVGAVNLESKTTLDAAALDDAAAAAEFLGRLIEELGGVPEPSLAERLARIAVTLGGQTEAAQVQVRAVEAAQAVSGMQSAALACVGNDGEWTVEYATGPHASTFRGWSHDVLHLLSQWVWAGTSSYFPGGEDVPAGYEFLCGQIVALSIQPLVVGGRVAGILLTADSSRVAHDPTLTTAMELLAAQTATTLAMVRSLEDLAEQATRDPLTGLYNRRRLVEALEQESTADRGDAALVLLDLDGFKAINDHHGHGVGDEVLCAVAGRLSRSARPADLVCRLGGDEFAILVRGVGSTGQAAVVADRFVDAVKGESADGARPTVGVSAGVRWIVGASASQLLVDADVALYAAKRAGRGKAVVWDAALRADELAEDALVADLRQALDQGALTLAYQPVADIRSGRVRGVEALARWHHPVRGPVPPSTFVPCAERAGLARDLTRWVLRTALTAATSWTGADDGEDIKIALNISASQLADDGVVHDVRQALETCGLPAERVILEVTETAEVVDLARAKQTLDALVELGVALALDDFGTGFSSLSHVQALPFHILKVDRSFVAAAALGDRRAIATIAAVCALAARIGVDVVAEGVEDLAQLPELVGLGCNHVQGYALARPCPESEVALALSTQRDTGWILHRGLAPTRLPGPRRTGLRAHAS